MVTQPAPVDKGLTVHREATLRQLAEYAARLLDDIETPHADEHAYAALLADNVRRVAARACWIVRSAVNPCEQERILALANPWLHEIRDRLESRARTRTDDADGTARTVVTEWVFDDADLTRLTLQADRIVAEGVAIDDARRAHNPPKAPAILYEDKLEDLRDRLMPERYLGPWIKFAGIRQWLDHCDVEHTAHCQLSARSRDIFAHHPKWLVDVERRCLVPARPGQRYLALSYVWGPNASFQTLTSNVEALQHEGALVPFPPGAADDREELGAKKRHSIAGLDSLARTVSDVIEFVDRLDEPYLWVDALCIVQDDEAHKQEHLAHMGSIYANAYATIVVANGAAHHGLCGIQDITLPMRRTRGSTPYTPSYVRRPGSLAAAVQRHMGTMQRSVWNKRAWTFQEQIFSRRLIILDDSDVTWECHCSVWLEGVKAVEAQCARNTAVVAEGFSFHMNPKFRDYADHVRQYNRRLLSYPEDSMDAFAGILTVLQTTFLGGFLCCLPVMFFDTALLWYNEGVVDERVPRHRRHGDGLAPTWSWAAYSGNVAFPDFSTAKEGVRPLVRWKYCRGDVKRWLPVLSLERQQPEKRFPTAAELQELVQAMTLEDGGPAPAGEPSFPQGTGITHHNILHARPERAVFNVLEFYGDAGVPLVGASGECVGVLTPCKKLGSHAVDAKTVISCELVAVSESFINGMETYNVLWIEKKGNVYVRKGVGRILKSDWVSQKPGRLDLLLV
ncbi:Heterokaryon incompatibility [Cordyceps fumosorosea ARSEF 2679]|uniref:Heterokaryon incompatibility n=1 Tax=Cordyceps fumosorosea (strain ARSEF 2679) TaxID=1081104 RepID=A0A167PZS9_CORFA|nr:Heterokaryon incompatibility [Cordyceps fumosorosea ARSEF 2679]OAA57165.1 Heterokaryon incompatibility [Cordyceps fumosorosea ARSEF 2679]